MTDTAATPDKEGFIEHLEHEVEDFVHGAEHDAPEAEKLATDAADVAEVVDPALTPVVDEVEKVGTEVVDDLEAVPADPTVSTLDVTPLAESPTTTPDLASSTPSTAPTSEPAPTAVIPETTFHDTREKQAAIDTGIVPGVTTGGAKALSDLDTALDGLESWITFARDAVKRARAL